MQLKPLLGEFLGTFILVLFGCGSIGYSLFIQPLSLLQISIVWGLAVIIAIFASSKLSKAHLNPAVSLGFLISKDLERNQILSYLLGQFIGAFAAAGCLYLFFQSNFGEHSLMTAQMFGEYYPNPSNNNLQELSTPMAALVEGGGTFVLMAGILLIVRKTRLLNPVLIGVLLSTLIYFLSPFTQAGFNPARDLAPRIFSQLNGWEMAFTYNGVGWMIVYVIAPLIGAAIAAILIRKFIS